MMLLGFVPLYDPLPALHPGMSDYWLALVVPLVVVISVVYKCTRVVELRHLPWEAGKMAVQILMVMGLAGVLLAGWVWAYGRFGIPFLHA